MSADVTWLRTTLAPSPTTTSVSVVSGPTTAPRAIVVRAVQAGVALDHGVGLEDDVGVDPRGGGVDDRDAGAHPARVGAVAQQRAGLGELDAVVDAERLVRVVGRDRGDDEPGRDVQPERRR